MYVKIEAIFLLKLFFAILKAFEKIKTVCLERLRPKNNVHFFYFMKFLISFCFLAWNLLLLIRLLEFICIETLHCQVLRFLKITKNSSVTNSSRFLSNSEKYKEMLINLTVLLIFKGNFQWNLVFLENTRWLKIIQ